MIQIFTMEKFGIEIKWASIFTLFTCVWAYGEKRMGMHEDFSNIVFSILLLFLAQIFIIFLAYLDKKKNYYSNHWTFTQAFKFGLFFTGLITIFSTLGQYIIYQSISPDYFENIISYQLKKGRYTRESLLEIHNINLKIREAVTYTLSTGVIFSALFSYILKNKTTENELK